MVERRDKGCEDVDMMNAGDDLWMGVKGRVVVGSKGLLGRKDD
jgi:hypothetical protein